MNVGRLCDDVSGAQIELEMLDHESHASDGYYPSLLCTLDLAASTLGARVVNACVSAHVVDISGARLLKEPPRIVNIVGFLVFCMEASVLAETGGVATPSGGTGT